MRDTERRFSIIALEPVDNGKRHLGHVYRVFYRNDPLSVDPGAAWDAFEENPSALAPYSYAELFTVDEADSVIRWVKRDFPQLFGVTKRRVSFGLNPEPPL
jgi:hypothetical protein